MIDNRFDYLSDGATMNLYERIRREQLQKYYDQSNRELIQIGYKRLASMYKMSESKEDYREIVKIQIN